MMILFCIIIWLIFGSFANALLYRAKQWISLAKGRSFCPKCKHTLWFYDLIPMLSYILLKWRCKHCSKPIGIRYILVELYFGLLFGISAYLIWDNFMMLGTFLVISYVLSLISFYDIMYLEILDSIIIPSSLVLIILSILWVYWPPIWDWAIWAAIIYSFFYLQILIPTIIFAFKKRRLVLIRDCLLNYFLFPAWFILRWFLSEKFIKKNLKIFDLWEGEDVPVWIGWWDLRMAIFMGLLLGVKYSIVALVVTYLVWATFWIIVKVAYHFMWKDIHQVPFCPLLSIWTIISLLYWKQLLDWYLWLIL